MTLHRDYTDETHIAVIEAFAAEGGTIEEFEDMTSVDFHALAAAAEAGDEAQLSITAAAIIAATRGLL